MLRSFNFAMPIALSSFPSYCSRWVQLSKSRYKYHTSPPSPLLFDAHFFFIHHNIFAEIRDGGKLFIGIYQFVEGQTATKQLTQTLVALRATAHILRQGILPDHEQQLYSKKNKQLKTNYDNLKWISHTIKTHTLNKTLNASRWMLRSGIGDSTLRSSDAALVDRDLKAGDRKLQKSQRKMFARLKMQTPAEDDAHLLDNLVAFHFNDHDLSSMVDGFESLLNEMEDENFAGSSSFNLESNGTISGYANLTA
ncbi:hypothetical protein B0H10DRAFT_2003081 [Mycena sp. CBHHK59/15]|nr:hypothetical protein B0H10DRAFT_2003081 [Mycena sp. CBHHK59/15]